MKSDRFTLPDGRMLTYAEMFDAAKDWLDRARTQAVNAGPDALRPEVERYLVNQRVETNRPLSDIAEDMAQDMNGPGAVLARYLNHLDDYPTLEEININGWDSIWLRRTDQTDERLEETFLSAQHAVDKMKMLLFEAHSKTLSVQTPGVVSYITDGVRNTVMGAPLVPKDAAVYASIRIVRPNVVTGENILAEQELSPDMLRLLDLFVKYRISTAVSGEKGAGKTSIINYLSGKISPNYRVGIIEEGSRELSIRRYDQDERLCNQVLSLLTRPSDTPGRNFDAGKLLELCLRFDLEYLIPQEVRDAVAYDAIEASRTGTAVFSSLHTNDAAGAYPRLVSMAQQKSRELSSVLLGYAVEGFPITMHMRKMGHERRCIEIVEATGTSGGKVLSNPLFRYIVEDNQTDADGELHAIGRFEQVGHLSDRLRDRMLVHGASRAELSAFL